LAQLATTPDKPEKKLYKPEKTVVHNGGATSKQEKNTKTSLSFFFFFCKATLFAEKRKM